MAPVPTPPTPVGPPQPVEPRPPCRGRRRSHRLNSAGEDVEAEGELVVADREGAAAALRTTATDRLAAAEAAWSELDPFTT